MDDAGGDQSIVWYRAVTRAEAGPRGPRARQHAREKLLDYNEADVRATRGVRCWLGAAAPGLPRLA